MGQTKQLLHPNLQTFFDEVIIFGLVGDKVKFLAHSILPVLRSLSSNFVSDRQTERQTNYFTPGTGGCGFFLQVIFATSLLALHAGGQVIWLRGSEST